MFHYVYLLEFNNGMGYIGMHSTTIAPELDTCYLGSGKALPPRNPTSCTKTILQIFKTREEAVNYEIELIKLNDCVKSPIWYNLRKSTFDKYGTNLSEEHKQQISQQQAGRSRISFGQKYSGTGRTPAQKAGDKRTAEKLRGIKNPAKGFPSISNNQFKPWYYITPSGEYVEVFDTTKLDYASKLGVTSRQLSHRFHYTNEHKQGKYSPFKGWIFGNLPRPAIMNMD
jgi:hypothetical protein